MRKIPKVKCWVEWQFYEEDRSQNGLDCERCLPETMARRRCKEDRWDFGCHDGPFPIKLVNSGHGFGFCPAKLIRDDPGTTIVCQSIFVRWKSGAVDYATMTFEEVSKFYVFIRLWENYEKTRDYRFLARLIGGDGKK